MFYMSLYVVVIRYASFHFEIVLLCSPRHRGSSKEIVLVNRRNSSLFDPRQTRPYFPPLLLEKFIVTEAFHIHTVWPFWPPEFAVQNQYPRYHVRRTVRAMPRAVWRLSWLHFFTMCSIITPFCLQKKRHFAYISISQITRNTSKLFLK